MYNGIGLQTPRGSGTNGHVQRNFAFVRPSKKDSVNYRNEEDIAKLEATTNRQPNLEILDHERKRKIEVKCAELEEVLETQGFSEEEIQTKVDAYRNVLFGNNQNGNEATAKDEHGRPILKETHEIAQAQQQKNARLREAFGISNYFVEGTSFDPERKAREELAKSEALQKEIQAEKDSDMLNRKRYALVRTPSPDKSDSPVAGNEQRGKVEKKKKKKRNRDSSSSPERKTDKKRKTKKKKSDRGRKRKAKKRQDSDSSSSDSSSVSSNNESSSDSDSDDGKHRRHKKSKKNKKKKTKKKRHSSRDRSRDSSVVKKTSKSSNVDGKLRSEEGRLSNRERSDKKVSRSSRSGDRDSRRKKSISREKNIARRSRSGSLRKQDRSESRKRSKYSKSPEKARNEKYRVEDSRRSQGSRSRQRQRSRSRTPRKIVKRSVTPKRTENQRSPKRRSPSPKKRYDNRRRSLSSRKRSIEKRRSPTPKRQTIEQRRERSSEKRRPAISPPVKNLSRRRTPSRDRPQARNVQRRSSSRSKQQRRSPPICRKRVRSRSPIPRKTSRYSRSPRNINRRTDGRNDRKSRSRSLSYSPARRNPEKYREILNKPNEKRKSGPVVKLHPTTSDRESSDNEVHRSKSIGKVEEFLPIDHNQDKELSRLKALKSELAAKAKESLEKKIISESATTSILKVPGKSSGHHDSPSKSNVEPGRVRELEIVAQTVAINAKEKQAAIKEREEKSKVSIKPFKLSDGAPKKSAEDVSKASESRRKSRKSRSRSKSSQRSRDDSSSSASSGSSRTSSSSRSSSASSATSASDASEHSRPRSRHSGSIPRRIGSPSFLDRRRITRSRSRDYRRDRR